MSYFNHAYKKTMLAAAVEVVGSVSTSALTAGQVGLVDAANYQTLVAGGATAGAELLIVQGNYNQVDILGGNKLHGGYAESIKSKVIKPKFINRLWKAEGCASGGNGRVDLKVSDTCFPCASEPQIRVDIKGESILRGLNRNGYIVANATGCCVSAATHYTGAAVVAAWADAINGDATLNEFVTATATGGALTIVLNAVETVFDDSSFDTRDTYITEPSTLLVTMLDDAGDACAVTCVTDGSDVLVPAVGLTSVNTKTAITGESILRDLILDGRYRQDGGHNQGNRDSARFREIEGGDKLIAAVDRTAKNAIYNFQHSVPRYNNPTGVFDNDQYVVSIAAVCGSAEATALDAILTDLAAASGVSVEDY